MYYFGTEGGGGGALNFMEFVVVNALGVFCVLQKYVLQTMTPKQLNYHPKGSCKADGGLSKLK